MRTAAIAINAPTATTKPKIPQPTMFLFFFLAMIPHAKAPAEAILKYAIHPAQLPPSSTGVGSQGLALSMLLR